MEGLSKGLSPQHMAKNMALTYLRSSPIDLRFVTIFRGSEDFTTPATRLRLRMAETGWHQHLFARANLPPEGSAANFFGGRAEFGHHTEGFTHLTTAVCL